MPAWTTAILPSSRQLLRGGRKNARLDGPHLLGASVQNVYINGKLMNEATINAAYAGIVNHVPVGLVIGDSGLEKQLKGDGARSP